jgi:hypothetical protein
MTAIAFSKGGLPRFPRPDTAFAEKTEYFHDKRRNTPHSAFYKDLAARSNEIWHGKKASGHNTHGF